MRRVLLLAIAFLLLAAGGPWLGRLALHSYAQAKLPAAVIAHADQLYRSAASPVAGDPDGLVNVVVFFDYNCPYCREGEPAIDRLEKDQSGVRLVLKELPLLGDDSRAVARLALAARAQGGYWPLHQKLFAEQGRATPERALAFAKELGLDTEKLQRDAASPAVTKELIENRRLADDLGVPGVPYYMVGDRQIEEGPDLYVRLKAAIAQARAKDCGDNCDIHAGLE